MALVCHSTRPSRPPRAVLSIGTDQRPAQVIRHHTCRQPSRQRREIDALGCGRVAPVLRHAGNGHRLGITTRQEDDMYIGGGIVTVLIIIILLIWLL